jgi:hypothetical protein
VEEEESENSRLWKMQRSDSPEFISTAREVPCPISSDSLNGSGLDTLTGKLKVHCPSFFNSLTTWEKLALDASSLSGAESGFTPCDPALVSLRVTTSSQNLLSSRWGYVPLGDPTLASEVVKFVNSLVRAHTTWSEPRVCLPASDTFLEVGASTSVPQAFHEDSQVGEALGGLSLFYFLVIEKMILVTVHLGRHWNR